MLYPNIVEVIRYKMGYVDNLVSMSNPIIRSVNFFMIPIPTTITVIKIASATMKPIKSFL
ncbi:MAG: hypothetical protein NVSMB24_36930 [Mucilaginibacter sp.]